MNTVFTDNNVVQWRPQLIKVTTVGNPEVVDGEPQAAYIDPSLIAFMFRGVTQWNPQKEDTVKMDPVECTNIWLTIGHPLSVLESPGEVNRLRDLAYGIKEDPADKLGVIK